MKKEKDGVLFQDVVKFEYDKTGNFYVLPYAKFQDVVKFEYDKTIQPTK